MLDGQIKLGECMLWTENVHGRDKDSSKDIDSHWIFHNEIQINELPYPSFPWLRIEIAKLNYLPGNECSAIFKTFWLKIVQRRWKKIYKKRREIKEKRKNHSSIIYHNRTGSWPGNLNYLPSLIDMKI